MFIKKIELLTDDLLGERDFYENVLELPVHLESDSLTIQAGKTELILLQAPANWIGAYHFCFNIPENQMPSAKAWLNERIPLVKSDEGEDEFQSDSWNSHSIYFNDTAGNILELIARHDQNNAVQSPFNGEQLLQISEIGLPSKDVIAYAKELCEKLGVSVYRQEAGETFTPIGDAEGLLILPVEGRIWFPNTGIPARLLYTKVIVESNGKEFEINRP